MTITPDTASLLKGAVRNAIASVESAFPDLALGAFPDGQGGAWLEMLDVRLADSYVQPTTFVVYLLPFNLPASDIYPLFVRPDLARVDGRPLGQGFQATNLSWPAEPTPRAVVQVSRRTRGAFASQTAAQKVSKVLDWMRSL